ncbi:hypothetical protein LWI29_015330 [Acer saccharum]|uniref:Uncharacterized protein n=1 Tax=Acer saccharum TaxID=4024 RepID=A0AA39VQU2_ACESA|nr:hypothetical protein LWI29_015330 [Acer saccharum]
MAAAKRPSSHLTAAAATLCPNSKGKKRDNRDGKLVKETQISSTSTGTVDIGGDGGGHVGGCRRWPADTVERKGFVIKGEAGWLWFWCSVAAADEICGGGGRG